MRASVSLRLGALITIGLVSTLAFQNCGQARSRGGVSLPSASSELEEAQRQAASITQNPARSLEALTPDRGLCAIRGGAGLALAPLAFQTQAACQATCDRFAGANPNRTCYWRDKFFLGDPLLDCVIRGGAYAALASLPQVTRGQCQQTCDGFAASAPNRICDWGTSRLRHPAVGTECRIFGGAGANLLGGAIYFASRTDCQNICDSFAANTYRSCYYGNTALLVPPESSKCEIWGGAGVAIAPIVYGPRDTCVNSCATFTANPNRLCWYGQERIR